MKKNWMLFGLAAALAAVYVVWFTDWMRPETVRIFHTSRNLSSRVHAGKALRQGGVMTSLNFGLSRSLKLTDIKVVPVAALQTNPAALPLWHLVSSSNSVPVKGFFYGQNIRGLQPAVSGSRVQALETNVVYRLLVEAGKIRGEHDFELK